jgi:16S rRNA (uracil1498-N3)-methyltransferase
MQRHRFYAPPSQFTESTVILDPQESHHLIRVLRLGEGARVFVFDGQGDEWECEVSQITKLQAGLSLIKRLEDPVESPLQLTLAQALVKGDKFDLIVQKSTELGVTRIVPLITDYTDVRRSQERSEQRMQRARRIMLEALKQSRRRKLVEMVEPIGFADFCHRRSTENNLFFSERHGCNLRETAAQLGQTTELCLWIASEGGWSDPEIKMAETNGFISIHLGPRILRTETAAIAAVALTQHLFGDMP